MTIIIWLLFMMRVASADSHNDPYSPDYEPHGSGFLWLALPLFYVSSPDCFHLSPPRPVPKLLSFGKSSLQAFWASMRWSFIGTTGVSLDFLSHRTFDYVGYRYVD